MIAGFDKSGKILFMTDSRGRNTSALAQIDLTSGRQSVLAANELADAGGTLVHPTEKNIQAVSFDYERTKWQVLDPAIAEPVRVRQGDRKLVVPVTDGRPQKHRRLPVFSQISYSRRMSLSECA